MRIFQKTDLAEAIGHGVAVPCDDQWANADVEVLVDLRYPDPAPGGWAALSMMFQPDREALPDRHDRALPGADIRQASRASDGIETAPTHTLGAP